MKSRAPKIADLKSGVMDLVLAFRALTQTLKGGISKATSKSKSSSTALNFTCYPSTHRHIPKKSK